MGALFFLVNTPVTDTVIVWRSLLFRLQNLKESLKQNNKDIISRLFLEEVNGQNVLVLLKCMLCPPQSVCISGYTRRKYLRDKMHV